MSDPNSTDPTQRLEGLGNITRETDEANPSPEEQAARQEAAQAELQAEQGAKDWAMVPFMIGGFVCMLAPELKPVYSEERCLVFGQHANQVAKKYGWDSPANMPELGLFACALSFAVPTFFTVREKLQAIKEQKDAGLLGKVVLWWRARKAAKAGAGSTDKAGEGAPDGGQQ